MVQDALAPVIANLGTLLLCATLLPFRRMYTRHSERGGKVALDLRIALILGLGLGLVLQIPVPLGSFAFDTRFAFVLAATFLGGPLTGLVLAGLAAGDRLWDGGPTALLGAGMIGLFWLGTVGYRAWLRLTQRSMLHPLHWTLAPGVLATLAGLAPLPLLPDITRTGYLYVALPLTLLLAVGSCGLMYLTLQRGFVTELATAQLRRHLLRRKSAQEDSQRLLGVISHEMRTPLNGLFGAVQLAELRNRDPDLKPLLDTAIASGGRLNLLITRLREATALEAGHLSRSEDTFALDQLLHELRQSFGPTAQARGLMLRLGLRPEQPSGTQIRITADQTLIRRILFELMENAIKFTPRGWVDCELRLEQASSGTTLNICVRDNGPGIPIDQLKAVQDRFVKLDPLVEGCGLGLSVARDLSLFLGGAFEIDATPDLGTTVRVDLPVIMAKPDIRSAAPPPRPTQAKRSLRVLVAEDDRASQMVVQSLLEAQGHRVTVVENGLRAVKAVSATPTGFDLVLMDIQMPQMDGLEAAAKIRDQHPDADLPILALTANAEAHSPEDFTKAGMQAVLSKPLKLRELEQAVAEHTAKKAEPPAET